MFVDNEGAKFALIKGVSENECVSFLCQCFADTEYKFSLSCWISRVPSFSNLADEPSRNDCDRLSLLGFRDVSADALVVLNAVLAVVISKMGRRDGS